jgi:protocatechuate 3,4-dioxygenase beta subunit
MKDRFWLKALAALVLFSALIMTSVVLLYRSAVTPEEVSEELSTRPVPVVVEHRSKQTGTYKVVGIVVDPEGIPVPGVRIEAYVEGDNPSWVTDEDGFFSGDLDRAGSLVIPDRASDPREVEVDSERLDLRFVVAELCPFTVHVQDESGQPLEQAEVDFSVQTGHGADSADAVTDASGDAVFPQAGCGVAQVHVHHAEHSSKRRRDIDTVVEQELTVTLVQGIWLRGQVVDLEDQPIHEASIRAGDSRASTDKEGSYQVKVDPARLTEVSARAEGYRPASEALRLPADAKEAELDLVMEPAREVEVYCAGLPNDSCETVIPIMCTHPWLPLGPACESGEATVCECPNGQGAVRGGGQSVGVSPSDEVVWLDFRIGGGIEGRVTQSGVPAPCTAIATYIPQSIGDMTKGLAIIRVAECDPDGNFSIIGLNEGAWMVDLRAGQDMSGSSRQLPFIQVVDAIVDVGEIDFDGGGRITGVVVDGLTGQGKPGEAVVAVDSTPENPALPRTATSISTSEGQFILMGLDDGDYDVFVGTSPFQKVQVSVVDGANPGELVLESRGADLLDEQGFHLITDEAGDLVVDTLTDGGLAQEAGLESGDRVDGVILFGMDLEEQFPDYNLSETVLGSYDGPGVSLKVDRDGQEVVIDL